VHRAEAWFSGRMLAQHALGSIPYEQRREEERKEKKKTHTLAHLVEVFVFFLR
jgi:hypothetical protein